MTNQTLTKSSQRSQTSAKNGAATY